MVFSNKKFEQILVDSIELKNEHQFKYLLNDLKINPDDPQQCFQGLSTFEKVLETPNSQKFIEICIINGSDFYRKNDFGVFPLRYAINSLNADNLKTIVQSSTTCEEELNGIQYSLIVNQKFDNDENFLHFLVNRLTEENYGQVSEMIKLMIINKCSPNSPNHQLETPFYILLNKLRNFSIDSDLVDFFIQHSRIDFYSFKKDEIFEAMEEYGFRQTMFMQEKESKDVNFMKQLLEQWNEKKFVDEFESFKNISKIMNDLKNDLAILLETATARNMQKAVTVLLTNGANVNGIPRESKFRLPSAFIACYYGHHEVLGTLLCDSTLKFKHLKSNLLHQISFPSKIHKSDRQKCFDILVGDRRCSHEIINGLDDKEFVPLFYACHYGFDEIAVELLRRGAFIGHESVINNISNEVLNSYLDECIKATSDVRDKNCEIHVDYRSLVPLNAADKLHLEVTSVLAIADNPHLTELVLHPVISSFLHLKWRRIKWLVYFNLFVYFCFMMFLGVFIINFFHDPIYSSYGGTMDTTSRNKQVSDENISPNVLASDDHPANGINDEVHYSDPPPVGINNEDHNSDPVSTTHANFDIADQVPHQPQFNSAGAFNPNPPPPPYDSGGGFAPNSAGGFAPNPPSSPSNTAGAFAPKKHNSRPIGTAGTTAPPKPTFVDRFGEDGYQPINKSFARTTTETPSTRSMEIGGIARTFKTTPYVPTSTVPTTTTQIPQTFKKPKSRDILSILFGSSSGNKRRKRSAENSDWNDKFEEHMKKHATSYKICIIGVILMSIYELIQCLYSPKGYFLKFSNWLDLILIYMAYTILLNSFEVEVKDFKRIRAVMILVMAAQSIQLIAKISILSMSLHMAIFKRVCATFLKTIALYLILILAFAMSFYTMDEVYDTKSDLKYLNGDQNKKDDDPNLSFSNPFISVITTVRMMLSDFDTFELDEKDHFQGFIFLLFVVLITVVLFNLLNALAISDTNNILKDAELVDTKKRISILNTYEKLFHFLSLSYANILPEVSSIMITPNKSNVVKVKNLVAGYSDVRILIHKTGNFQKFVNAQTSKLIFWKRKNPAMTMGRKTLKKILNFVKKQQQVLKDVNARNI